MRKSRDTRSIAVDQLRAKTIDEDTHRFRGPEPSKVPTLRGTLRLYIVLRLRSFRV